MAEIGGVIGENLLRSGVLVSLGVCDAGAGMFSEGMWPAKFLIAA